MYNNIKEYYYEKILFYCIKNKCHKFFRRNKKSIKELVEKIVNDHNEYLLTESFICYLANNEVNNNLNIIASNNKYAIYELFSLYYQELIKSFNYSSLDNKTYIRENDLTKYLDMDTKRVMTKTDLMFLKMCRMNDLNIYYFALMKLTIFYIITYCHINDCMNDFDNLLNYYQDDIYKIKDEIVIHGIDIMDNNNELIERISSGINNKKKKEIN